MGIGEVIFCCYSLSACFLLFTFLFFMPVYFFLLGMSFGCYFTGSFFVLRVIVSLLSPALLPIGFVVPAQKGRDAVEGGGGT